MDALLAALQIKFVTAAAWSDEERLKLWLLMVLLFSYVSWLVSGLSAGFQNQAALATLVSLVSQSVRQ